MPKIVWTGFTKDFPEMKYEEIGKDAVKIRIPDNNMTVSFVFALPFIALLFASLRIRTAAAGALSLDRPYAVVRIALGLALIVAHEFLHACVYPKDAVAYIGVIPKKFMAYTACAAPLTKRRFIMMSLLPMLLGMIPYILFLLCPIGWKIAAAILWPCAMIGLVSPCPDYLNVFCACRQVPKGALIQDGDDGMYWYLQKDG